MNYPQLCKKVSSGSQRLGYGIHIDRSWLHRDQLLWCLKCHQPHESISISLSRQRTEMSCSGSHGKSAARRRIELSSKYQALDSCSFGYGFLPAWAVLFTYVDLLNKRSTPGENTAEREPKAGLRAYTTDSRTMIIDNDHCQITFKTASSCIFPKLFFLLTMYGEILATCIFCILALNQ